MNERMTHVAIVDTTSARMDAFVELGEELVISGMTIIVTSTGEHDWIGEECIVEYHVHSDSPEYDVCVALEPWFGDSVWSLTEWAG